MDSLGCDVLPFVAIFVILSNWRSASFSGLVALQMTSAMDEVSALSLQRLFICADFVTCFGIVVVFC